jgi:transposase
LARSALAPLAAQFLDLAPRIKAREAELLAWHRTNEESRRLETIPGVGFITATAIAATVTDPSHFRSGREFAAWLGLTPRQNSSAGKSRLAGISKMGDRYLRSLLFVGATAVIRFARTKVSAHTLGLDQRAAGQQASEARSRRPRQQDGSDRMGCARPQRGLSRSSACRLSQHRA